MRSDSQNRPLGTTLEFDPRTFEQGEGEPFSERPMLDRVIGIGVAAHEGQLFGWFNQLLGLLTAIGYLTLVVTSFLMWRRRRPQGRLARRRLASPPRLAPFVIGLVVLLAVLLPTLGVSLCRAGLRADLARFAPGASRWLGLKPAKNAVGAEAV